MMEIRSYDGAGALRLGMSRASIRAALGVEPETFMKTTAAALPTDDFQGLGVHVEYEGADVCASIEMMPPAEPTFRGVALIGRPYREVRDQILALDPGLSEDGAGFTSDALGFGVYAPSARKEPDEPVESVIVFRRNYYDQVAGLVEKLKGGL
ncbi:MAG: hypothetical protein IT370_37630 [Deltaproteobacteria bacterium]|nr:hypothetical protein [Deltaproteobacteria bacterium]